MGGKKHRPARSKKRKPASRRKGIAMTSRDFAKVPQLVLSADGDSTASSSPHETGVLNVSYATKVGANVDFKQPEPGSTSDTKAHPAPEAPDAKKHSNTEEDTFTPEEILEIADYAGFISNSKDASPVPMEYSNEARVCHAQYASLSEMHDQGKFDACREGSLQLLMTPGLPRWTKVQTLQMLSTLMSASIAEELLNEAGQILASLDQDEEGTQLLTEDNRRMLADLELWRGEDPVEGDDEPSAAWVQDAIETQAKIKQELREELRTLAEVKAREESAQKPTCMVRLPVRARHAEVAPECEDNAASGEQAALVHRGVAGAREEVQPGGAELESSSRLFAQKVRNRSASTPTRLPSFQHMSEQAEADCVKIDLLARKRALQSNAERLDAREASLRQRAAAGLESALPSIQAARMQDVREKLRIKYEELKALVTALKHFENENSAGARELEVRCETHRQAMEGAKARRREARAQAAQAEEHVAQAMEHLGRMRDQEYAASLAEDAAIMSLSDSERELRDRSSRRSEHRLRLLDHLHMSMQEHHDLMDQL